MCIRVALAVLIGVTCGTAGAAPMTAAADQGTPGFMQPGARIFVLAGGGRRAARDGVPATDVRLGSRFNMSVPVAALPDGSVATLDATDDPIRIDPTGTVRRLPLITQRTTIHHAEALVTLADGSLLAVAGLEPVIYRLVPGASSWAPVIAAATLGNAGSVNGIAALDGGGFAVATDTSIWRVGSDGAALRWAAFGRGGSLAGLADGELAVTRNSKARIITAATPATAVDIVTASGALSRSLPIDSHTNAIPVSAVGLAGLPDGGLLRAVRTIDLTVGSAPPRPVVGGRPGFGLGDGGPPMDALTDATSVGLSPDGALVEGDLSPLGSDGTAFDLPATIENGSIVTTGRDTPLIRIIVPPGTTRPLAAIAAATFTTLRDGRVAITSTVAGTATLDVRTGAGRRIMQTTKRIGGGDSELALPARPPADDLRLRLTVRDSAGQTAVARASATTVRVLHQRRAAALAAAASDFHIGDDEGGYSHEVGRCHRRSDTRIDCLILEIAHEVGRRDRSRCISVAVVRLRPDGARVVIRDGCGRASASPVGG